MVRLHTNGKKIICLIAGERFELLKDILKEYRCLFHFHDDLKIGFDKYWEIPVSKGKEIIAELKTIEPVFVPPAVNEMWNIVPETEYFRLRYNPELLKEPPLAQFQEDAIRKGTTQSRLALFLKQGLGKTYVTVGILNHLWSKGLIDKILICCRSEGVYNFKRELLRFNTFGLKEEDIYIVDTKHRKPFQSDCKVVISKYDSFRMICQDAVGDKNLGKIKNVPIPLNNWGKGRALILDESHTCKNKSAKITKCLIKESVFFRFRYLLTGTPYPKGVDELWSQFQILDKNIIGCDYFDFVNRIAKVGTRWSSYQIAYYKEEEVKNFIEYAKKWIVREFADDKFKFPDIVKQDIYVHLDDLHYEIYKQYVSYRLATIMNGNEMKTVLKEIYNDFPRIQLAVTDPTLLKGKVDDSGNKELIKLVNKFKFEDNSRLKICDSLIEDELEKGRRIILWSGHPITIMNLGEHYKKYSPIIIHGEMDNEKGNNRAETISNAINEFKTNDEHKILIASYNMIATSANIGEAQTSIYWDRPWSFEKMDQSLSRNRRADGKYDCVYSYNLVAEKTIDEKLSRVLEKRDNLDKELLNTTSMGKEELKKLFSGMI